jgi:hypothetical protein
MDQYRAERSPQCYSLDQGPDPVKHTSGAQGQIFITVLSDSCGFVDLEHSLTRGRLCRLQFLLVLASAVILESEFRGTRDHILLCQVRVFPFRCTRNDLNSILFSSYIAYPCPRKRSSQSYGLVSKNPYQSENVHSVSCWPLRINLHGNAFVNMSTCHNTITLPWKWTYQVPTKRRYLSNWLHGVGSDKTHSYLRENVKSHTLLRSKPVSVTLKRSKLTLCIWSQLRPTWSPFKVLLLRTALFCTRSHYVRLRTLCS